MTNPKDIIVFPCKHLSICNECAKIMSINNNRNNIKKCPVCRNSITSMLQLKY